MPTQIIGEDKYDIWFFLVLSAPAVKKGKDKTRPMTNDI